jgi:signal peptidase II
MQRYAHLFIILPVFVLDRWTKLLVVERLPFGGGLEKTSWLSIVHWQNKGGLFGLMAQLDAARYFFLLIPLVIIAGLAYYLIRMRLAVWSRVALTFVLAGAIGNMYDRFFYGFVVDFIDVHWGAHHWPAFNVADMSITFGIGLWLVAQLFLKEGTRAQTGSDTKQARGKQIG